MKKVSHSRCTDFFSWTNQFKECSTEALTVNVTIEVSKHHGERYRVSCLLINILTAYFMSSSLALSRKLAPLLSGQMSPFFIR